MKEKVRVEVNFEVRNGRTLSRRKEYFDNGKMASEGLFSNGSQWGWNIPAGTVRTYFKNGQLKSEEIYDETGNRDGESKYYNEDGVLLRRTLYNKDRKTRDEYFDRSGNQITPEQAS